MGSGKGGWVRLQAQDHEQRNRFLEKVRGVHLVLQLLSCGRFPRQGSGSILEAKQELMVFPVLLLDQETFSARQALPGPVSSPGKESTTLLASVLPSEPWEGTGYFLPCLDTRNILSQAFSLIKPGTPTMCKCW